VSAKDRAVITRLPIKVARPGTGQLGGDQVSVHEDRAAGLVGQKLPCEGGFARAFGASDELGIDQAGGIGVAGAAGKRLAEFDGQGLV